MSDTQSCDLAILVLLLGWLFMVAPSVALTFLVLEMRRDQLVFYELMREWSRRSGNGPRI